MKIYHTHESKYSGSQSSSNYFNYNNYNHYNNKRPNNFHGPPNKKPKYEENGRHNHKFNGYDKSNGTVTNGTSHHKVNGLSEKQNGTGNHNRIVPKSLKEQRESLPVYKLKDRLLEEIRKTDSLIVIGETGSGKTTQIPQLLLESNLLGAKECIGITSPRRVAAITIAQRVAQEQNCTIGTRVGYCVRFEDATGPETRIKFVTDGIMVREAMSDECLGEYSYVILDEAHERSVHTDVLLGVTRRAQKLRRERNLPKLKLIIMSATMDVDKYAEYFKAPVVYLEGRQHEIRTFHAENTQDDYVLSALVTVFQIHRNTPANEDIVVFLTGQEEIEIACQEARKVAKELDRDKYPPLKVFPLYSALPTHQQLEAMKPSAPGMRKLVLATNIAETSITIGGIRTVIDTGRVKVRTYHPTTGMDVLRIEKVSKAQAWQRCGRAGRETAGKCYRTLTVDEFEELKDMPTPEIQRCSLAGVALQLLAIGIDITTFEFMDKPPEEAIESAINCLEKLKAIKGSPMQLTGIGRTMSLFPLDPRFTKVILASVQNECLEEALSVIALLSGESVYVDPISKRQQAVAARTKFVSDEGDHITLLNVYRNFEKIHDSKKKFWCYDNFLHFRNLSYAANVRSQLAGLAEKANLTKSSCGKSTEKLRKSLLEGLFENLASLQRDQNYVTVTTKQPVQIHPSSTLHGKKPQLVLYTEIIATTHCYIRDLSIIDPEWVK